MDMVAASGQPKLWDLTPADARKKVIELTRMVECKEAIGKIEDRTMPGPAGPLSFRIYTAATVLTCHTRSICCKLDSPNGGASYEGPTPSKAFI